LERATGGTHPNMTVGQVKEAANGKGTLAQRRRGTAQKGITDNVEMGLVCAEVTILRQ
jgi:hypothetical protein